MSDRKQQAGQNETPEDVAKLYSWANLQGARYRDFSAERAQSREQARPHADAAEADGAAEPKAAEDQEAINVARQAVLNQFTQQSSQQFYRTPPASQPLPTAGFASPLSSPAHPFAPQTHAPVTDAFQPERMRAPLQSVSAPARAESGEAGFSPREIWSPPAARENPPEPPGPPAWLADAPPASRPPLARPTPPTQPIAPIAPIAQNAQGGLQDSRDRVASRWYALQGVFDGANVPAEAQAQRAPACAPVLALFSLAGGVGKTSLAATLGRVLSAQGERVLLVDTAAFGLLPFYFGARDHRVGVLRTFSPPGVSTEAPVQLAAFEPETLGSENSAQDGLLNEVQRFAQGVSRVIVDLPTASGATARRILRLAPTVLVPLAPDMNSVVSVASLDAFFEHNSGGVKSAHPYYVLNQFDALLPLHLDVREALRAQLGERLLPFVIRHSPAVSEALAEGMTVIDYVPETPIAEDFENLANWLKQLASPTSHGYRGVRWSER